MEKLVETALTSAPSLTVLVCVVWMFLKNGRNIMSLYEQLHNEHMDMRADCRAAIDRNTHIMERLADKLEKLV